MIVGLKAHRAARLGGQCDDAATVNSDRSFHILKDNSNSVIQSLCYTRVTVLNGLNPSLTQVRDPTIASLSLEGRIHPLRSLTLSAGPEVLWGDSKYTQTFFGLTTAQSAIADLSPYAVKSSINSVRLGLGADYLLTSRWMLAAHVTYGKLQGDAADSPVNTDKTQRTLAAFALYRF